MRVFGPRSRNALSRVHPVLIEICVKALQTCETDFTVIEGYRGKKEQELAFVLGNTKAHYPNSAHNQSPAVAVDIIPYPFKGWNDKAGFAQIASAMFAAAKELGVELRHGGDFNRDGDKTTNDAWDKPHFELHPWRSWKKGK